MEKQWMIWSFPAGRRTCGSLLCSSFAALQPVPQPNLDAACRLSAAVSTDVHWSYTSNGTNSSLLAKSSAVESPAHMSLVAILADAVPVAIGYEP